MKWGGRARNSGESPRGSVVAMISRTDAGIPQTLEEWTLESLTPLLEQGFESESFDLKNNYQIPTTHKGNNVSENPPPRSLTVTVAS